MWNSRARRDSPVVGWLACVTLLAVAPWPAAAQAKVIAGAVVNTDGRTGAPAILVEAYDARRTLADRTLSDSVGRFTLTVGGAGAYTVVASRVGYRASIASVDVTRSEPPRIRIVLTDETVHLTAARITTDDVCGPTPDGGALVATAWEEVRKVVVSATVMAGAATDSSDVTTWRSIRRFDATGPIWQDVVGRRFPDGHAGGAASRATDEGAHAPGGAMDYFGPDAEQLVSEGFEATHCFHLTPPTPLHPGEVGVAFRPTRPGMNVVEVSGVAWIDTATAILRRLEYTYSNGPPEFGAIDAGGWIEFDRAPSGLWLVHRWSNLVPAPLTQLARPRDRPTTIRAAGVRVIAAGGSVAGVGATGSGPMHGVLRVQLRGDVLTGATVELADAGVLSRARADGSVVVADIPPGAHTALVSTDAMRGLGLPPIKMRLTADSVAASAATIELPSERDLLVARCGSDADRGGLAVLYGHAAGREVAVVTVTVAVDSATTMEFSPATDDVGRWFVCGVPRGRRAHVTLRQGGRSPGDEMVVDIDSRVVRAGALRMGGMVRGG